MSQIQPIDGAYFASAYFWTTTAIALVLAVVAVLWNSHDERRGRDGF